MPQAPPPEQPQYGQAQPGQPQYAQPGYAPTTGTEKNWMGITSLVLTLASLILGITVIGGIILGHMSVAAAKRGEANNGTMGRVGMVLGYIFLVLGIIATVALIMFFGWVATECGGTWPSEYC